MWAELSSKDCNSVESNDAEIRKLHPSHTRYFKWLMEAPQEVVDRLIKREAEKNIND